MSEVLPADAVPAAAPHPHRALGWLRNSAVVLLLVLATLLALLSPPVIWGRNLLLNTDRYVSTLTPLAANAGVQQAVITEVDKQIDANLDVKALAQSVLPPAASALAGPLAAAATTLVNNVVTKFVQSPAFQKLWVTINRVAHTELVALLTGKKPAGDALTITRGSVLLDLSAVVVAAKSQLVDAGLSVASQVPVVGATIKVAQIDGLEKAQAWTRFINKVANWLPWVMLLFFAGAIALAHRRRRTLLIAAGCVAGAMVLLALILNVARHFYINGVKAYLDATTAGQVYDTLLRFLHEGMRIVFVIALVVLIGAWLFGPARPAKRLRASAVSGYDKLKNGEASNGPVGKFLAANHFVMSGAIAVIAMLILVLWSNPSLALVLTVLIVAIVAIGVIELLHYRTAPRSSAEALPAPS